MTVKSLAAGAEMLFLTGKRPELDHLLILLTVPERWQSEDAETVEQTLYEIIKVFLKP